MPIIAISIPPKWTVLTALKPLEEFVFGERTQLVVDPGEEKLKAQFEGVVRSFVPMHSIVRIDEVERLGTPKISEARGMSNVMPFPMPMPEK